MLKNSLKIHIDKPVLIYRYLQRINVAIYIYIYKPVRSIFPQSIQILLGIFFIYQNSWMHFISCLIKEKLLKLNRIIFFFRIVKIFLNQSCKLLYLFEMVKLWRIFLLMRLHCKLFLTLNSISTYYQLYIDWNYF